MALFSEKQKNILFWVFAISLSVFFCAVAFSVYYPKWQGQKRVEELKQILENYEKAIFDAKAADKIGGKTPSETLDMFISAVEAGDYELASKYFVLEKQGEELKSLQNSNKEDIENAMKLLKETNKSQGEYSEDKNALSFYKPLLVNFILYPSGNWKIEEI